jgi:rhamnogalacturonyl hydrolase YesR
MWRQLIDRPESWEESSGTAMFTYAFVTGVMNGWLPGGTYGPAARKAWMALVDHLTPEGLLREVCVGTGKKNDLQHYLDRPRVTGDAHGQAPMLWSANALLR